MGATFSSTARNTEPADPPVETTRIRRTPPAGVDQPVGKPASTPTGTIAVPRVRCAGVPGSGCAVQWKGREGGADEMNNVLEPGSTFAGYTIERVLGRGGMGTVYLAEHPTLRRKVALKLLDSSWVDDDYVRSRFESEADYVAQLEHSNIVTVYDRGRIGNRLWISMQYVPGIDARAAVSAGPIDIVRAVHIVTETGERSTMHIARGSCTAT